MLEGKHVLITGGTGSLGRVLVRRILGQELGAPASVTVFSRDEAKQHAMRLAFQHRQVATDESVFEPSPLHFRVGDVCDINGFSAALRQADVVFHAAALKQVPTCEYAPFEAVKTNVLGAENLVRAIREQQLEVEAVIGITTDKACKPVNVMGMTKALQERIFIQGNLRCPGTRFVCVRYGNVLASRGSVIPLFHEQIRNGGPVTITTPEMTRFLISLDDAVDTVFAALAHARPGEIFVPRAPSARIVDVAEALIGDRPIETHLTGIRPGEKIHEIMVSDEEAVRTVERGQWYGILPMLPELRPDRGSGSPLLKEYSSEDCVLSPEGTRELLKRNRLLVDDGIPRAAPAFAELRQRELLQ